MARAKAKAAATSKTWLYAPGGKVHRADDPAAPKDWTWWCNEHDAAWTKRGEGETHPLKGDKA